MKDDLLILESANPDYETRYFNEDDVLNLPVTIIGKVLNVRVVFESEA